MTDAIWREPIQWVGLDGKTTNDSDHKSHPFILINVSKLADGPSAQMLALVDIGATHSILHREVIDALKLSKTGQKEMSGNWSLTMQDTYDAFVQVVACPGLFIGTDVTELEIVGAFTPRAVVGTDVLQFAKLVLQPGDASYLEFRRERLVEMTAQAPQPV